MSRLDQAMLEANMPRLRAQRLLDQYDAGNAPGLHPDALYEAVLLVTESEHQANAARVQAIKANMRP